VLTGLLDSTVDSITGTPAQAGISEVTITAWELPGYTGDSFSQKFTFQIVNPPLPQISQSPSGGNFPAGANVSVSATQDHGRTFTWKRDGTALPLQEKVFFTRSDARRFRAAPTSDPGAAWRSGDAFVESTDPDSISDPAWTSVAGGIGYDSNGSIGGSFAPHFVAGTGNLQTLMFGSATPPKPSAIHLRMPFSISGTETLSFLTLRVQCDDGFVAWLNGTEIASLNKPDPLAWNSGASVEITGAGPVTFRDFDVSPYVGLLRQGGNLLAVQAMNRSPSSADFLFNCELAGGVNATNSPYLAITSIQPPMAGNYVLTVANPAGTVDSTPATLTVGSDVDSYSEWRTALFPGGQSSDPAISGPAADPDGDGYTNEQEYVFGTQPLLSGSTFLPDIAMNGNEIEVTFTAQKATGAGFAGRTRHYAVEISDDLAGPWSLLPAAEDVVGNDQSVIAVLPQNAARRFCRVKVWLTP
jgi:hypothetical protein